MTPSPLLYAPPFHSQVINFRSFSEVEVLVGGLFSQRQLPDARNFKNTFKTFLLRKSAWKVRKACRWSQRHVYSARRIFILHHASGVASHYSVSSLRWFQDFWLNHCPFYSDSRGIPFFSLRLFLSLVSRLVDAILSGGLFVFLMGLPLVLYVLIFAFFGSIMGFVLCCLFWPCVSACGM